MASHNGVRNNDEIDVPTSYRNVLGIPLRKGIIIGVTVVFFLFLTFVSTYLLLRSKPDQVKLVNTYSHAISLASINTSVDPCSNFYEFTCGLMLQNQSNNIIYGKVNAFTTLQNKVNEKKKYIFKNTVPSSKFPRIVNDAFNFYNQCINVNRNTSSDLNYILKTFDKMGGWPILQTKIWEETHYNWISASVYLLKYMDIETIFGVHITVDDYNTSSNMIYITLPYVGKDEFSLKEFYNRQMLYIILYTLNPDANDTYIIKDVGNLQKIETLWREIIATAKGDSIAKSDPIRISLHNLQKEVPEIDFVYYIQLYLKDSFGDLRFKLSEKDTVLVQDLNYLKKAASILLLDPFKRDLANLFGWLLAQNSLILIPDVMKNYAEANQYDLHETMETIEDRCYEKTLEIYECSFDYLYIQNVSHDGVTASKILV